MKTKKKVILALLTLTCLTAGSLSVAACGGEHTHTYATSWTAGETQHYYAATCGHTDEKLAAADHVWGVPQVTTPATETVKGEQTLTCVVCGKTKTESIDYAGHTYSANWTADATNHWHAATCAHTGEKTDSAAHTWGEWQTVIAPTHTAKGVKIRSCTVCNYAQTDEEATTGAHTYDETHWVADESGHWFAANCGHDEKKGFEEHNWIYIAADSTKTAAEGKNDFCGYHQKKCAQTGVNSCNYVTWEAHNFVWTTITPKDCFNDGEEKGVCECGYEVTRTIKCTGHPSYTTWMSDETYHWHALGCEHAGDEQYLTKIAHDFNAGEISVNGEGKTVITKTCTVCKYVSVSEVTGVTGFDLKVQAVSASGNPTGAAAYIENGEIHILPNATMNFDFVNFEPADSDAFEDFKTSYKQIKVYEIAGDGTKTELSTSTEPILESLDWRTATGGDVVFFKLKVTDGNSHKIRVESAYASKEFTVIPDEHAAMTVKYSLDNGATWNTGSRVTITTGQTIWFTTDVAGYNFTPPEGFGTVEKLNDLSEFDSEIYAFTSDEAGSSKTFKFDLAFVSKTVRLTVSEPAA